MVEIEQGEGCLECFEEQSQDKHSHFSPCLQRVGETLGSTTILGTPKMDKPFRSSLSNNWLLCDCDEWVCILFLWLVFQAWGKREVSVSWVC